ncbi:hypothetical protein MCG13_02580 [Romboutsia hominis]|nr:hypothetical protein [Romboutsia hominis]MCH1968402.1 hypothetical protein [Romboutsia hominis]
MKGTNNKYTGINHKCQVIKGMKIPGFFKGCSVSYTNIFIGESVIEVPKI